MSIYCDARKERECEAIASPEESMKLSWCRSELLLLILPQMVKNHHFITVFSGQLGL